VRDGQTDWGLSAPSVVKGEGFYFPFSLGKPRDPQEELESVAGVNTQLNAAVVSSC